MRITTLFVMINMPEVLKHKEKSARKLRADWYADYYEILRFYTRKPNPLGYNLTASFWQNHN